MKCKKVSFVDEKFAKVYIEKLHKTSKRALKPVNSYLCHKCLLWHLTSIESKENMQLIYKERQINNLKAKIISLKSEIELLNQQNNDV
jgi:hypothetical protein